MSSIKVKFVSKKISKVRWRPKSSSVFVTGSWDDNENNITLWRYPTELPISDELSDSAEPCVVASEQFLGNVTDLKVVSDNLIFAASSLGSVLMYNYTDETLRNVYVWKEVHRFGSKVAGSTSLSCRGDNIISAGEDGRLCIINFETKSKLKEIESADSCCLTAVCYLRNDEIVVGNSLGYLRTWDLRRPMHTPGCLLMVSREQAGVSCMQPHPMQSHILATGHEDGSLCIWDMRHEQRPITLLEGHSAAMSELLFHPANPDYLFTCSLDGSVWQWDASKLRNSSASFPMASDQDLNTTQKGYPWLNCEANKHRLEITSLFSRHLLCVNSLDFSDSVLLWGTDNEALYILNGITV